MTRFDFSTLSSRDVMSYRLRHRSPYLSTLNQTANMVEYRLSGPSSGKLTYWVTQKSPQIYTAGHATIPIRIRKITVQIFAVTSGSPSTWEVFGLKILPSLVGWGGGWEVVGIVLCSSIFFCIFNVILHKILCTYFSPGLDRCSCWYQHF